MCEAAGQDEQLLSGLAALFEACRTRAEPEGLQEVGQLVAERAADLIGAPGVVLCHVDSPQSAHVAGACGVRLPAGRHCSPRAGALRKLIDVGGPVELDGRTALKALGLPIRSNGFSCALCAAFRTGESSTLLLFALGRDERHFLPTERAVAAAIAECAGSAMAGWAVPEQVPQCYERLVQEAATRERLEREAAALREQLASVRQTVLQVASAGDRLDVLEGIVQCAAQLTAAAGGAVYRRLGDSDALEAIAAFEVDDGGCAACRLIRRSDPAYRRLWSSEEPVVFGRDTLPPGGVQGQAGECAWIGVPVRSGGKLTGALVVQGCEHAPPADAESGLLAVLGALAVLVAGNRQLLETERQQRQLAEALAAASSALTGTLHLDEVLDRILEQTERVVPGDAFNVMLIEGGTAHIVRQRGYEGIPFEDDYSARSLAVADYPPLAGMLRTGQPAVVTDTRADRDWVREEGQDWLLSYVGAPIRVGDVTVGFLNVDGTRPGQFGEEHGERLRGFADQAAVAIENALLYRRVDEQNESLERRVRQRTAEVQTEYAQLEAVLDSSSDGIVVVDGSGSIVRANRIARAWLTRSLSPKDGAALRDAVLQMAEEVSDDRPSQVLELTGMDLHLAAAPVEGEEAGGEHYVVVALHDVTPLRALARMKSQFVSSVSHELRTPVTTIKLYASLLRGAADEKRAEYLDKLEEEADRQACLIEDILQIAQIDLGRVELDLGLADLGVLATGIVESFVPQAAGKQVVLAVEASEDCPLALADEDQIARVLNNLVANALRHTQVGGSITLISRKRDADGRSWATLTVKDNGSGIPEDELPRLFERFFRGRETREMQAPGTGVGLALAKAIVELHGGRITVESRAGSGAAFTVWLPPAHRGDRIYHQTRLDGW
jgi:signal transduction histidine kinase